ncbi:hypothetical protein ACJMK2_031571 [Sinanodonta woodiana]|uniref:Tyrosine-protein kinase n=1 Tax=Sinanodonta woodiana TaxID=1069815 RepID=A0ABD3WZ82_SINWO
MEVDDKEHNPLVTTLFVLQDEIKRISPIHRDVYYHFGKLANAIYEYCHLDTNRTSWSTVIFYLAALKHALYAKNLNRRNTMEIIQWLERESFLDMSGRGTEGKGRNFSIPEPYRPRKVHPLPAISEGANKGWYFHDLSDEMCEKNLYKEAQDGFFMIRNPVGERNYILSVYNKDQKIVKHYPIRRLTDGTFYLSKGFKFSSIPALVSYHKEKAGVVATRLKHPPAKDQRTPTPPPPLVHVKDKEQGEPERWEYSREEVELQDRLGAGNFGVVYRAKLKGQFVALKCLKNAVQDGSVLEDIKTLINHKHKNLVQVYGLVADEKQCMIITELMLKGSLLVYIRKHKQTLVKNVTTMLEMCQQICSGMVFLEEKKIVHRNLAARNCLLGEHMTVKVNDSGISRYVIDDHLQIHSSGNEFPLRWSSPEILSFSQFSNKSDIWAFGVVMWEVFSGGTVPYKNKKLDEVAVYICIENKRLKKPRTCPDKVFNLICACWKQNTTNRGGKTKAAQNGATSNNNGPGRQRDGNTGGTQKRNKNGPGGQREGNTGGTQKSNQSGPGGQGDGKKGSTQQSNQSGPKGQGDGKKGSTQQSNQSGPKGQGDGKKGSTQQSNQNVPGGQGDGTRGNTQQSNESGPGGQGDGKKGSTQQSGQNGTGGHGDGENEGMQQSSLNDMAGAGGGNKEIGLEPPSSSEADASIVSFVEKLLDVLCNVLENNIQDFSAIDVPSFSSSTKSERALEEKLKTIQDKAIEMVELSIDRNSEANYASELLKELSDYSLPSTDSKIKELSKPPKKSKSTNGESDHAKTNKFQHGENRHSRHFKHLDDYFSSALKVFTKQIEADHMAQLLKTLSEFPQTYDKNVVEKMLRDPPKLFIHVDEDHNKLKDPKYEDNTENNAQSMNMKELSEALTIIFREMEEKQSSTEKVKSLMQELDSLREQTHRLEDEVNTLRFRLSELASAKMTHDNPTITDLSDPDRPTKLAEKYSILYDNQWTDAFAELTKSEPKASEKAITEQLLNILTDGFNFCKKVRQDQVTKLEQTMLDPAQSTKSSQSNSNQVNEIFTKHLRDAAKACGIVTSENIFKAFVSDTKKNTKYEKWMKVCGAYIEECVRLCWLMQVQNPPVCIDLASKDGQPFLKDAYREYTSSGKKIAFIVWPALFLHEKGPLLIKGVAQGK